MHRSSQTSPLVGPGQETLAAAAASPAGAHQAGPAGPASVEAPGPPGPGPPGVPQVAALEVNQPEAQERYGKMEMTRVKSHAMS